MKTILATASTKPVAEDPYELQMPFEVGVSKHPLLAAAGGAIGKRLWAASNRFLAEYQPKPGETMTVQGSSDAKMVRT